MNNLSLTLASSPRLQIILDNTTNAIRIADPEFQVKWNQALKEWLRQNPIKIAGKNMIDLLQLLCCVSYRISGKIQQAVEKGFLKEDLILTHPATCIHLSAKTYGNVVLVRAKNSSGLNIDSIKCDMRELRLLAEKMRGSVGHQSSKKVLYLLAFPIRLCNKLPVL